MNEKFSRVQGVGYVTVQIPLLWVLACNPSYGERIKIDGSEYIVVLDVRVRQEDFEKKGDLFDSGEVWLASESLECKIAK